MRSFRFRGPTRPVFTFLLTLVGLLAALTPVADSAAAAHKHTSCAHARPGSKKARACNRARHCRQRRAAQRRRCQAKRRHRQRARASSYPAFAPKSPWNRRISTRAKLDGSSSARVAELADYVSDKMAHGIYPGVNAGPSTGARPSIATAGERRVPVQLDTGPWGDALRRVLSAGVPIPPAAAPAGNTDSNLVVYQPSTDTMWEFWRASLRSDGWHAQWGGAIRNVSESSGFYTNKAWPGLGAKEGWNWGASASSSVALAGVIRMDELRAASINHAIGMLLPYACSHVWAWPAQRTDGRSASANCIPEGARLRLDPRLDVDRLNLTPAGKTIARAAQVYGLIAHDTSGGSVAFDAERNDGSGTDPFGGQPLWKTLDRFPWRSLEVLRMDLCTSQPCQR